MDKAGSCLILSPHLLLISPSNVTSTRIRWMNNRKIVLFSFHDFQLVVAVVISISVLAKSQYNVTCSRTSGCKWEPEAAGAGCIDCTGASVLDAGRSSSSGKEARLAGIALPLFLIDSLIDRLIVPKIELNQSVFHGQKQRTSELCL